MDAGREPVGGMVLAAFRPRFADYVLKMPRGAQVVYPKDLGPIVVYADVYKHNADPNVVSIPLDELTSKAHAASLCGKVDPKRASRTGGRATGR